MEIDYTEITVKLMEEYTAKYLQENAELIQATIEATKEALDISRVVGQSEQLPCHQCSDNGGGVTDDGWEQCDCQK